MQVLVPVDGSDCSLRALARAIEGLIVGSVANKVIHLASVPVTLVK